MLEKNRLLEDGEYESSTYNVKKSTLELFGEFYELVKGEPLEEKRLAIVKEVAVEAEDAERN